MEKQLKQGEVTPITKQHPSYEVFNRSWKSTLKILLGDDDMELEDAYSFLTRVFKPAARVGAEGSEAIYLPERYSEDAPAVKAEDVSKATPKLSLDEIKDVERLYEYAAEFFHVVGSRVLGRSLAVYESTGVVSSQNVWNSNAVFNSKDVVYSSYIKESKYIFGTHDVVGVRFLVNSAAAGGGMESTRLFESFYVVGGSADIYYSHNIEGCQEMMFSFFQKGKRYMIGNVQLSKEKYLSIKSALLEQIMDELKGGKLPHLYDLLTEGSEKAFETLPTEKGKVMPRVEQAYTSVTKALFGKSRSLERDEMFLTKNLPYYDLAHIKNAYGDLYVGAHMWYFNTDEVLSRVIPLSLFSEFSKPIKDSVDEQTTLEDMKTAVRENARLNFTKGVASVRVEPSIIAFYSSDVWMTVMPVKAKLSAYSFFPRESAMVFGSNTVYNASSVIRSYASKDISRVFEVDDSSKVFDAYYCFACEALNHAMFSFGVSGKSYSILNNVVSSTEYKRVEAYLKEYLAAAEYPPRIFEVWGNITHKE